MANPGLDDIKQRLDAGEWLTLEDGVQLYESSDIHTLGELANSLRERLHGRRAYYSINLHVNYTNYCVLRCKFCSFYRPYPKGASTAVREAATELIKKHGAEVLLETAKCHFKTTDAVLGELDMDRSVLGPEGQVVSKPPDRRYARKRSA